MTLDDAIEKLNHYWYTGMDGYFDYDEIYELVEFLEELKMLRGCESNENRC